MFWHGLTLKVKSWVVEFLMCASADSAAELTHFSILYFHAETPGCPPDVCPNDPLFHDARWFAARPREQGQSEGVAPSLHATFPAERSSFGAPVTEQLRRRLSDEDHLQQRRPRLGAASATAFLAWSSSGRPRASAGRQQQASAALGSAGWVPPYAAAEEQSSGVGTI